MSKIYKCNRCNKHFKQKGDYSRHQNRKFPCKIVEQEHHQILPKTEKSKKICTEISPNQEKSKKSCTEISPNQEKSKKCCTEISPKPEKKVKSKKICTEISPKLEKQVKSKKSFGEICSTSSETEFFEEDNSETIISSPSKISLEANVSKKYECQNCHNKFSTIYSRDRHSVDRCKMKPQIDKEKEYLLQKLIKEMEVMKDKLQKLESENANSNLICEQTRNINNKIENQQNINKIENQQNINKIENQQNNRIENQQNINKGADSGTHLYFLQPGRSRICR